MLMGAMVLSAGWTAAHILAHITNFHDKGAVKVAFAHEVHSRIAPMVAAATGLDVQAMLACGPVDVLQKFLDNCMDIPSVMALAGGDHDGFR